MVLLHRKAMQDLQKANVDGLPALHITRLICMVIYRLNIFDQSFKFIITRQLLVVGEAAILCQLVGLF